jgi:hypothetical protein
MIFRTLLVLAVALMLPLAAHDALAAGKKKPTTITVTKKHVWKGYGFLPGYPRSERERRRDRYDATGGAPRYIDWWGERRYGFGRPGFYRGQYNGGSFGPCWTSTPIGMQWNCGM